MDDGPDEVLDLAPWRLPRWLVALAVVAVVVAATLVVRQRWSASDRHRTAAPLPSPTATSALPVAAAPLIALSGRTLVVLTGADLRTVDTRTDHQLGRATVAGALAPAAIEQLALDPAAGVVWVVTGDASASRLGEYRLPGLEPIRTLPGPFGVRSTAALDGNLYLTTDHGLAEVNAQGRQQLVPGLSGAVGSAVADPDRGRIIAIDLGYPTDLWTYRPGSIPVEASMPLAVADGTVTVAAGRIWLTGHVGPRALLWQLDPRTFAPVNQAPPPTSVGPSPVVAAAGGRVLWLRSAGSAEDLQCVDAVTGRAVQTWAVAGAIASTPGRAYVGTAFGVLPLPLSACAG